MGEPSGGSERAFRRVGAADQIAEVLRDRILNGRLRSGDQLTESELAREFDVSRNTVREGLRLLTMGGLATHEVHRGVTVRTFSEYEVRDLYEVRAVIEREVARVAGKVDAPALRELRSLARCGSDPSPTRSSGARCGQFHTRLVGLLGSARLDRVFFDALQENRVVEGSHPIDHGQRCEVINLALVDLLEDGSTADGFRAAVTAVLAEKCAEVIESAYCL